jgi:hypothetical protein
MKVLDSAAPQPTGLLAKFGRSYVDQEAPAQEAFIAALQKQLDNKYILLRNITLEGPDVPIPLILAGPTGLRVIYASQAKGLYRAKEESWELLDERTQRFRALRPNLIQRAAMMAQAVQAYLLGHGQTTPEIEAALYFSDPGVNVEMLRPAVRIIPSDGVDRYVASVEAGRLLLTDRDVERIVTVLRGQPLPKDRPIVVANGQDAFSMLELPEEEPVARQVFVTDRREPTFFERIPFTGRQLTLLMGLVLVNILIFAAAVIVFLLVR